jgi:putative ABC transport system permease protein
VAFKGWVNGFAVEGRPNTGAPTGNANYRVITPDYLRALGIPLRQGRGIESRDTAGAAPVVLINESMARKFWPNEDPVGRRLAFDPRGPWIAIVGVIADIRQAGLDAAPKAEMYLPAAQEQTFASWLAIQAEGDPARLAPAVRQTIRSLDPLRPIVSIRTMDEILDRETSQRRVHTILLAAFAGLALLLACVGIYGVLAYLVSRRTQEIGIRMAVGASPRDVLRAVLGEGLALGAAGIVAGTAAAFALTRVLSKALFGVTATDPATFAGVAALMLAVASLASYIPARRATKVDPILVLREE